MSWLNPGRWLLYGGLVVALVLGYLVWQEHQRNIGYAQAVEAYQAQAAKANTQRAAVAKPIEAAHRAAVVQIQTVTRTIIKEVPVYVQATDCPMSGGFRLLHDAVANGKVPDAAGISDAAPAAAEDVASTVADNYGACHETAQRLIALQQWINQQQSLN